MKIGTFLKRVKRAGAMTIKANGGSLQIWLVVAFLALASGAMYATVQESNGPDAASAVGATKVVPSEPAPVSDLDRQIERAKECFPTYTNLEMKVYDSLKGDSWGASSDQSTIMNLTSTKMSACAVQRKVLDILAKYPGDQRSEALAAMIDAIERRH
jgi:hypothetical protein